MEKTLLGECDEDQILLDSYGTDTSQRDDHLTAVSPRNETIANGPITDESVTSEPHIDESVVYESVADGSVAGEMVSLWEYHVLQKLNPLNWKGVLHLTEERKDQLEALFAFHFQNDIRLWERFCLRVKTTPFLMGGGPNGWRVSLTWILREDSVLKILEGTYDNLCKPEKRDANEMDSHLAKLQPNPVRDAEKAAIISSIKDPVWKNWCAQLAFGVRLNEFQMRDAPLSSGELSQIANARFLECEDEKLVWVGSPDPSVLNKIENLSHKITWVFAKEYPKARCFRTRLLEENLHLKQDFIHSHPLSPNSIQQQGDIHHA